MRIDTRGKNAIFSIIFAMRVHVLALDDVFDPGLSAVLDAFQTANELAEMVGFSGERFDVKIVGSSNQSRPRKACQAHTGVCKIRNLWF